MTCLTTDCAKPVFARGLCQACYTRQRRNGTTARKNVVNSGACAHPGCDRDAFSKNLCAKHYQSSRHPLYTIWQNLRSRAQGAYPAEWDDLDAWLAAVGERPSPKHQLRRPDPEKSWSTTNMVWREPIDAIWTADKARYQWLWHLRNRYGLTEGELEAIVAAQGGNCPICTHPLEMLNPKTGKPMKVCIDHDHKRGGTRKRSVRGVLHDLCNKGLGALADVADNCRRAASYLDAHDRRKALGVSLIDEINATGEANVVHHRATA